ncbi:hypothetical protein CDIK_3655, partial [Cucumispora dikerogammari]
CCIIQYVLFICENIRIDKTIFKHKYNFLFLDQNQTAVARTTCFDRVTKNLFIEIFDYKEKLESVYRVSRAILKMSHSILKMSHSILKMSHSILKMSHSILKMSHKILKTYNYNNTLNR